MQRRAAAAYVALFVIVAAGSYGVIAVSSAPSIQLSDAQVDHEAGVGQSFTVNGTEFTVANITKESSGGGGHGGGGTTKLAAKFGYDVTEQETEELGAGDTIQRDGKNWSVQVPNGSDPTTFELVEQFTVTKETTKYQGGTYVVVMEDGNRTLVPYDEYVDQTYGEPETREFSEGDAWTENLTVMDVTGDGVVLDAGTSTSTTEVSATAGANVTLAGQTYMVHVPNENTVQLTTAFDAYQSESHDIDRYHERVNGLWGTSIISSLAALLLIGLAYLPRKES